MNVRLIADDLYHFLQTHDGTYGKVHSVFKNTINIQTEDESLISLFSDQKDITPMSLIVGKEFDKIEMIKDMEVLFNRDGIVFPEIKRSLSVKSSKHWVSEPEVFSNNIQKRTYLGRMNRFEKILFEKGNDEGILNTVYHMTFDEFDVHPQDGLMPKLNDYSQFIYERLESFLEGVALRDEVVCGICLGKVVGFGPGLTPSVDDFVAGVMVSTYYLANYYQLNTEAVLNFNAFLLKEALGKTTAISEQMLKHASKGLVSNQYRNVLLALYHELDLKIETSVEKALCFGETSGTDFLLGVYVINKMFMNKKIREVYNGD